MDPCRHKVAEFSLKCKALDSCARADIPLSPYSNIFKRLYGTKRVVSPLKCHLVSLGKEKICHSYFTGQSKY